MTKKTSKRRSSLRRNSRKLLALRPQQLLSFDAAMDAIVECQQSRGVAALVAQGQSIDPHRLTKHGVNLSKLLVSEPDNEKQASEIVLTLLHSGAVDLVVVV